MLTLKFIQDNKELVVERLKIKNFDAEVPVQNIIAFDNERKKTQEHLNAVQAELKVASGEIGKLMKAGQKEEAEQRKERVSDIKERIQTLGDRLSEIEISLNELLVSLPNIPHQSVPEGNSDIDNLEEKKCESDLPKDTTGFKPHWDLIEKYDIIDFKLGTKITGAGFPVYKGKGARLQRALINFFLEEGEKAGYNEVLPPILVNQDSGFGTGQLPDKEGQMYYAKDDNLYLIPTAEVPVTNIYRDVILKEEELPLKNIAYTPCFRREAGSWGAHVRGLNRLHQFDKVEIVQICHPNKSYDALEEMANHVESLIKKLELPYRKLRLCGGDLSFTSALTFDFEVYSSGQQRWLEVSSVSNFENYQANRLNCKFKGKDMKKAQLAHTLNGSALALPRIVAAILENNQTPEGIRVPKVLVPYMNGVELIN